MGQFLVTKGGVLIEVDQSWPVCAKFDGEGNIIQQGGHIALLTNGAYCHITGNAITSEEEINAVFRNANGQVIKDMGGVLADVLEWFAHRHDHEETPLQRVMFNKEGWPFFETGAPVEKEADLYQCLKPGPVLTAAIVGLHMRRAAAPQEAKRLPEVQETPPLPPEHEMAAPVNPSTVPFKSPQKLLAKRGAALKKAAARRKAAKAKEARA